ncbi:hypothetical protein S83_042569 [Arachis hypogaea]
MAERQIHSTVNLETPLKSQQREDGHETDVTPSQEEVPPGYKNHEPVNPETRHFARLGDDYHHAMQEMRHRMQELERCQLELQRQLAEHSLSRRSRTQSRPAREREEPHLVNPNKGGNTSRLHLLPHVVETTGGLPDVTTIIRYGKNHILPSQKGGGPRREVLLLKGTGSPENTS